MKRAFEGSSVRGMSRYYLLLWVDRDTEHAFISDDLEIAMAKRADVRGRGESRVLSITAQSQRHVVKAWEAGRFDGVSYDLNFRAHGDYAGVDSVSSVNL